MTRFIEGWWNCFNSFANNSYCENEKACIEVLNGAGVTKTEIQEILTTNLLYGYAYSVVVDYLSKLEE